MYLRHLNELHSELEIPKKMSALLGSDSNLLRRSEENRSREVLNLTTMILFYRL